jgi:hypothetical protein
LANISLDCLKDYINIIGYLLIPPVLFYASKITGEFTEEPKKNRKKIRTKRWS